MAAAAAAAAAAAWRPFSAAAMLAADWSAAPIWLPTFMRFELSKVVARLMAAEPGGLGKMGPVGGRPDEAAAAIAAAAAVELDAVLSK